jgi:hypothetical protein
MVVRSSMRTVFASLVSLLFSLAAQAPAQRTWTVDAANGPGTDFLDLPPALVAAADGDTIRVRAGRYQPGRTSKALTILGENEASLSGFELIGLPAGKTFVLAGFYPRNSFTPSNLKLTSCAGRVHLEGLRISGVGESFAVSVASCRQVTMTACDLYGNPALDAANSAISVTNCYLTGLHSIPNGRSANEAVISSQSTCIFSGGGVRGGDGWVTRPAATGIISGSSALTLGGPPSTVFAAGKNYGFGTPPSAISTSAGGTVLVDPVVQLVPAPGGPPISGSAIVTTKRFPSLVAGGVAPGGTIQADLFSPANENVVLLAGLPGDQIPVTPFSAFWIDPRLLLVVGTGVQGSGEAWRVSLPVPLDLPRGLAVMLQGLSGPGLALELSTPTGVILH